MGRGALMCCYRGSIEKPPSSAVEKLRAEMDLDLLRKDEWKEYKYELSALRKLCPPAMPVLVKFSKLPVSHLGQCVRRQTRFVIRLNSQMNAYQAIDVLIHEWAHALAWNYSLDKLSKTVSRELFDEVSHDETWGCAYSRVYRIHTTLVKECWDSFLKERFKEDE